MTASRSTIPTSAMQQWIARLLHYSDGAVCASKRCPAQHRKVAGDSANGHRTILVSLAAVLGLQVLYVVAIVAAVLEQRLFNIVNGALVRHVRLLQNMRIPGLLSMLQQAM